MQINDEAASPAFELEAGRGKPAPETHFILLANKIAVNLPVCTYSNSSPCFLQAPFNFLVTLVHVSVSS